MGLSCSSGPFQPSCSLEYFIHVDMNYSVLCNELKGCDQKVICDHSCHCVEDDIEDSLTIGELHHCCRLPHMFSLPTRHAAQELPWMIVVECFTQPHLFSRRYGSCGVLTHLQTCTEKGLYIVSKFEKLSLTRL